MVFTFVIAKAEWNLGWDVGVSVPVLLFEEFSEVEDMVEEKKEFVWSGREKKKMDQNRSDTI